MEFLLSLILSLVIIELLLVLLEQQRIAIESFPGNTGKVST